MYGSVRTVVWEDGGSNPASYPIILVVQFGSSLTPCSARLSHLSTLSLPLSFHICVIGPFGVGAVSHYYGFYNPLDLPFIHIQVGLKSFLRNKRLCPSRGMGQFLKTFFRRRFNSQINDSGFNHGISQTLG